MYYNLTKLVFLERKTNLVKL